MGRHRKRVCSLRKSSGGAYGTFLRLLTLDLVIIDQNPEIEITILRHRWTLEAWIFAMKNRIRFFLFFINLEWVVLNAVFDRFEKTPLGKNESLGKKCF